MKPEIGDIVAVFLNGKPVAFMLFPQEWHLTKWDQWCEDHKDIYRAYVVVHTTQATDTKGRIQE